MLKLTETHKAHLPSDLVEDLLDPEADSASFGTTFTKVRMVDGCVRLSDEVGDVVEYWYRGFCFEQRDNVPTGYWGRWAMPGRTGHACTTMAEMRAHIDSRFHGPKQETRPLMSDEDLWKRS